MLTQSKKRLSIAIVIIVVGFLFSGAFGSLNSKLTSVQENNNSSFLPKGAEATLASQEIEKFSKGSAFSFPALILFEGAVTPEALGVINSHLAKVSTVPLDGTDSVIGDFLLEGQPIVAFPSGDGKAILVNIPIDGNSIGENLSNEKPVLPAVIEALRKDFKPVGISLGLNSYVTGPGGILGDLFGAFGSLDLTLTLVTFLVVALILVFVYRSPVLWFIPLLTAFFALSVAGGIIYLLAKSDVLDVDGQSQGILSVLVIGAATDYALLLIARYREELHHFEDRFDAMKAAYKGVWEPVVASGSTVSIALLMLLFSQLSNTAGLGPVGAIGIVSAVLMTLTLLPAFLLIPSTVFWFLDFVLTLISLIVVFKASGVAQIIAGVFALILNVTLFYFAIDRARNPETARFNRTKFPSGRWVFWPRTPFNDGDDHVLDGTWSKIANRIGTKPRKAWIFTGLALLALAFTSTTLKADGLGTVDSFTSRPESVVGSELLVKHFPGGEGDPTVIVAAQGKADAVIAAVSEAPGVTSAEYAVDSITQNVKFSDGKVLINVTLDKAPDSVEAGNDIPAIREAAHRADPTSLVGGTSAVYYDVRRASSEDNRLIIPLILLVITIILGFLLRSILSAVVLLGTVVLSYYATLGVCALVFNHVFGFAGGDNSFPLFAFVFLVALGVDYNIFLMTRVREESGKLGTRAGVIKGVTVTGAVITSAGVVLAATFVMLGLIPLVPLRQLGFAVAFGVLLDTIIVRSILVPALVHEIGPKIWWPSKLSKKLD